MLRPVGRLVALNDSGALPFIAVTCSGRPAASRYVTPSVAVTSAGKMTVGSRYVVMVWPLVPDFMFASRTVTVNAYVWFWPAAAPTVVPIAAPVNERFGGSAPPVTLNV